MARNAKKSSSEEGGNDWYQRWISDIAKDAADHMTGEPERRERMSDLRHRLDQLHQRLSQLTGGQRGRGPRGLSPAADPRSEDDRILAGIHGHLADDLYVDASDIEVGVLNGEVTLSGTVDSRIAKRLAEDCCDSVLGVRDVRNNLRIRHPDDPVQGGS